MPPTADTPLTPKQKRFVAEYLVDYNGTQAAIRAGYSARSAAIIATENLRKPNIAAAIASRNVKTARKLIVTKEWVIRRLLIEAKRTGEGSSHSARVRAAELLGKHVGLLDDPPPPAPPTVNVNLAGSVNLKQLNDDQLAQLVGLLDAADRAAGTAAPVPPAAGGPQPGQAPA